MSQMKEQDKTSEKELNETEISSLPDKGFKIMVIKTKRNPNQTRSQAFWLCPNSSSSPQFFQKENQGLRRSPKSLPTTKSLKKVLI